jgi:hypothetical protein
MSVVHPEEILETILAKGCRRDKADTLRKLHELCMAEYNRHSQGARDLSIAHIARLAESHKLLKLKTMWNPQSADYVSLIKAWEAFNGPKASLASKQKGVSASKYAFLEKIEDPAVRSMCELIVAERDRLRAELNMLKGTTTWNVDLRPKTPVARQDDFDLLTESEISALTKAIEAKTISARDWSSTSSGGVVDVRGKPIYDPGYITGIEKTIRVATKRKAIENKSIRK